MANPLETIISKIDRLQQNHRTLAFPYAVIKKHGEDEAGNLSALITYYGFLSLFPLLLVATTIIHLVLRHSSPVRDHLLEGISRYFPVLGNQLQSEVHSLHKTGLALIIGLILTFYGARGGANSFQAAMNHIWQVPRVHRPGFPGSAARSFIIIMGGGLGFLLAAVLSSYATGLRHIFILGLIPTIISLAILTATFFLVFKFAISSRKAERKYIISSSLFAAVGVQILQSLGYYLVTHQVKNLGTLYGNFAIVLGLLFWIYLQVQIVIYAVEIGSVRALNLWPRSIMTAQNMTEADKTAYELLAKKERYQPPESIRVRFKE